MGDRSAMRVAILMMALATVLLGQQASSVEDATEAMITSLAAEDVTDGELLQDAMTNASNVTLKKPYHRHMEANKDGFAKKGGWTSGDEAARLHAKAQWDKVN